MNTNLNKSFKRTKAGNYFGYYNGYYIFAMKCVNGHGGYFCQIGCKGQWLWSEGYHAKSLPALSDVKKFVRFKIDPKCRYKPPVL